MRNLTNEQFRSFLDLIMCSDPWPVSDSITSNGDGQEALLELANTESQARGYPDWIEAFHCFSKTSVWS